MERTVAGIYPDRQSAERAAHVLRDSGLHVVYGHSQVLEYYPDAEDVERLVVVVEPLDREAEARSMLMQTGATRLQGHGSDGPGSPTTPSPVSEDPVPVQGGERPPEPGVGPNNQATDTASGSNIRVTDPPAADPLHDVVRDAAPQGAEEEEMDIRLRRGSLGTLGPR